MRLKYTTSLTAIGLPLAALLTAMPAAAQTETNSETRQVDVSPYIEVSQILVAELSPGDEVLTYTQLAAGIDTTITGRNNGGSVSLRYERNIGYGDNTLDTDTISGVARGYATIVPNALTFEAGALASRTNVDGSGASTVNPLVSQGSESQIYSGYAGPNIAARAGDVYINGLARVGYTKVETQADVATAAGGADRLDVFDDSVTYQANLRAATKAGEALPVGIGIGGGIYQEDISNLDQRVRDVNVRADVTVPVSDTLQLVGGVGYEDVEVSSRDALFDVNGDPVIDDNGRFVTDRSQPRQLAYDVDGIIWDVGAVWRPSSRTALSATVGRRYDSTTYYGSFAYAPSNRSSVNISVYDGVQGFGGTLTNSLAALPTDFSAARNALTGDFSGCVSGDTGASCVGSAFGSIRSATFRSRGVQASYSRQLGRSLNATVAAGYDRRTFIAGENTVLAAANGLVDESYYVSTSLSGSIGRNAGFALNAYGNRFDTETNGGQTVTAVGGSAAYNQTIVPRLSARAAVSLDHFDSDISAEDITTASGLVGLRYDF
ncbi:MAG: preprotein translocase subunit YajC [Erythrobacter sp.]